MFESFYSRDNVSGCPELIKNRALWKGREYSNWTTAVGDLDCLTGFDASEKFTRALPQLPDANARHVLLVAHTRPAPKRLGRAERI